MFSIRHSSSPLLHEYVGDLPSEMTCMFALHVFNPEPNLTDHTSTHAFNSSSLSLLHEHVCDLPSEMRCIFTPFAFNPERNLTSISSDPASPIHKAELAAGGIHFRWTIFGRLLVAKVTEFTIISREGDEIDGFWTRES